MALFCFPIHIDLQEAAKKLSIDFRKELSTKDSNGVVSVFVTVNDTDERSTEDLERDIRIFKLLVCISNNLDFKTTRCSYKRVPVVNLIEEEVVEDG